MNKGFMKLGKKIILFFVFILLVNIASAVETKSDVNYKLTFLIGAGVTTNYSDIRVSSVAAERGVGNYTDGISYLIKRGILYVLNVITEVTPPTISDLRNISTTNESSSIEWSCSENCNYSILWFNNSIRNNTYLVNSIYNNTFKTSHNPYLANLTNSTTYFINLTVWDGAGNSATNNTFNFTTAANVANTAPTFDTTLTNQQVTTPNSLSYDIDCSDADSDTITYYDNTSLFAINSATGLIEDTPSTNEAGTYTINITCGDGTDNTSQTFDYTIVVGGGDEAPPSGGGGGGGGAAPGAAIPSIIEEKELEISEDSVVVDFVSGRTITKIITITNPGDTTITVNLDIEGLEDYLFLSDNIFDLEPGESKTITLNIMSEDIGTHIGKIIVRTEGIEKLIPIMINVESEKILFDVEMDIPAEYRKIRVGDDLLAQISLLSMGDPKKENVSITYLIKDLDNNIISEENEIIDVENELSFVKLFHTKDLKSGEYAASVEVGYADSIAITGGFFMIEERLEMPSLMKMNILSVVFIIIFISVVVWIIMRKRHD